MEWRSIPGYEDHYEVSEHGQVRNMHTGRVLSPRPHWGGYSTYQLGYAGPMRSFTAHRLVALAFIGEPTGPVIRHLDGNPQHNHWTNLAYGTHKENSADSIAQGTNRNGNTDKTHCDRGHEFTDANTRISSIGRRICVTCWQDYHRERQRLVRLSDASEIPGAKSCTIDGCTRAHYATGLCANHYAVERRRRKRAS